MSQYFRLHSHHRLLCFSSLLYQRTAPRIAFSFVRCSHLTVRRQGHGRNFVTALLRHPFISSRMYSPVSANEGTPIVAGKKCLTEGDLWRIVGRSSSSNEGGRQLRAIPDCRVQICVDTLPTHCLRYGSLSFTNFPLRYDARPNWTTLSGESALRLY